ncbi:MAG: acid protease [Bacteroidetes bacterium HGW-Bacteroidetes-2]|jgi:predicted aspartyl protease|nr:MAG: acid protease [Bacteroidetes bacterium HGW-Bacteroidetes-2]
MEAKGFNRIALKRINTNHFEFKAKVNGINGSFILDTGASNSCIGTKSISHFKLHVTASDVKAAGAGAVNMLTQVSVSNTLQIGKWTKNNVPFVIFDLSHVNEALHLAEAKPVEGILGADILKTSRAVIDYGRNCLYLKE